MRLLSTIFLGIALLVSTNAFDENLLSKIETLLKTARQLQKSLQATNGGEQIPGELLQLKLRAVKKLGDRFATMVEEEILKQVTDESLKKDIDGEYQSDFKKDLQQLSKHIESEPNGKQTAGLDAQSALDKVGNSIIKVAQKIGKDFRGALLKHMEERKTVIREERELFQSAEHTVVRFRNLLWDYGRNFGKHKEKLRNNYPEWDSLLGQTLVPFSAENLEMMTNALQILEKAKGTITSETLYSEYPYGYSEKPARDFITEKLLRLRKAVNEITSQLCDYPPQYMLEKKKSKGTLMEIHHNSRETTYKYLGYYESIEVVRKMDSMLDGIFAIIIHLRYETERIEQRLEKVEKMFSAKTIFIVNDKSGREFVELKIAYEELEIALSDFKFFNENVEWNIENVGKLIAEKGPIALMKNFVWCKTTSPDDGHSKMDLKNFKKELEQKNVELGEMEKSLKRSFSNFELANKGLLEYQI